MRLKTFLATYILFLCILFLSFGIVSVYMTDAQMDIHLERSSAEFLRIRNSLSRDIALLHSISTNLLGDLTDLLHSYMEHYARDNVSLFLRVAQSAYDEDQIMSALVYFETRDDGYFVVASGLLPEPFEFIQLDYRLDITLEIGSMNHVRNVLLLICIALSILTAFALYFILSKIFNPLSIVSSASRKIASGNYDERINISGKNEIAAMSEDFNSMADEISRQIQVLREESKAKQQYIDNFAHEMRTPLTSIYGYAEYMQRVDLSEEETIEAAQYIMDEASHMKNMAGSLLTLATLRGYSAHSEEISVGKLFEEVKRACDKLSSHEGKTLKWEVETDIMWGQEDLIKILLVNLCNNALDACDESGVVTMGLRSSDKNVILSVSDNGRGIPSDSLDKITEPFYRVDKARSRESGGAGLGLALCRRIAEVHGATLTVRSVFGEGTTVEVIFTTPLQVHDNFIS